MIPNYEYYDLIGIGDFSHGDENIWVYRLKLLKYFIETTDKNITIFKVALKIFILCLLIIYKHNVSLLSL